MDTKIFAYIDPNPPVTVDGGVLSHKSVAIQPNMSVRGWPTEAGSQALSRYVALEDATVVERMRAAGATITGNTYMSELGFGLSGDTSAQGVMDGMVDMALITDTMGEARVAASRANLFGFKPSYGIVSRFGLIGLIPSMESYGIVAKTPRDIAAMMQAVAGRDERDFSMPDDNMPDFSGVNDDGKSVQTIGVVRECRERLEPPESSAFDAAVARLKATGVTLREVSVKDFDLFSIVHNVIGSVEASSSAGKYDGVRYGHRTNVSKNWNEMYLKSRAESFGPLLKCYLFQGAYFQFENYEAFEHACRIRSRLVKATEELFDEVDVLILPTRQNTTPPEKAQTVDDVYNIFSFTVPANVTGNPSLHVPGSLFGRETDIGIQVMGPLLSDAKVLSLAMILSNSTEGDV
jgi:aspartyl-tRNA(Asn)/glutamyl-tRNA(Gln) amidotransferase subunit A